MTKTQQPSHNELYSALDRAGHNVSLWADDPSGLRSYAEAINFDPRPVTDPPVSRVDWLAEAVFTDPRHGGVDVHLIGPDNEPAVLRFISPAAAADFAQQLVEYATRPRRQS